MSGLPADGERKRFCNCLHPLAELSVQWSGYSFRIPGPQSIGALSSLETEANEGKVSYCHDLHLDYDFDRAAFAAATRDIGTLIRRSEIEVVGPGGRPNSLPVVEECRIAFNGVNHNCICGSSEPERRPRCPRECRAYDEWGNDTGQPFIVDVGSTAYLGRFEKVHYWFDCKTRRKPYDKMVQMAMMALKHHLGDSIELHSKGNWAYHWGAGHEWPGRPPTRDPGGAVEIYEHVFPERAPVQNILAMESIGF